MKKRLIKWLLPLVIGKAIEALERLALKTSNDIDDSAVRMIKKNKNALINEISNYL